MQAPTKVAWAPDGRMFAVEKGGRLKVVPPGSTTGTTVLDLSARVNHAADRGLLGLAVDASFSANRFSISSTPTTSRRWGAKIPR